MGQCASISPRDAGLQRSSAPSQEPATPLSHECAPPRVPSGRGAPPPASPRRRSASAGNASSPPGAPAGPHRRPRGALSKAHCEFVEVSEWQAPDCWPRGDEAPSSDADAEAAPVAWSAPVCGAAPAPLPRRAAPQPALTPALLARWSCCQVGACRPLRDCASWLDDAAAAAAAGAPPPGACGCGDAGCAPPGGAPSAPRSACSGARSSCSLESEAHPLPCALDGGAAAAAAAAAAGGGWAGGGFHDSAWGWECAAMAAADGRAAPRAKAAPFAAAALIPAEEAGAVHRASNAARGAGAGAGRGAGYDGRAPPSPWERGEAGKDVDYVCLSSSRNNLSGAPPPPPPPPLSAASNLLPAAPAAPAAPGQGARGARPAARGCGCALEVPVAARLGGGEGADVYSGWFNNAPVAVKVMRAPSRGGAARPPLARAVEMAVLSAAPHPAIVQSFACFPGMYLQTESENESENGGGLAPEVSLLGGGAGRGGGLCSAAVRALRARPLAADDASDDGCDVVVMELCDRGTLADALSTGLLRPTPAAADDACGGEDGGAEPNPAAAWAAGCGCGGGCVPLAAGALLLDVAAALHFLHSQHLAHGNLRAENVLLKTEGAREIGLQAKLCGFGAARIAEPPRGAGGRAHAPGLGGALSSLLAAQRAHGPCSCSQSAANSSGPCGSSAAAGGNGVAGGKRPPRRSVSSDDCSCRSAAGARAPLADDVFAFGALILEVLEACNPPPPQATTPDAANDAPPAGAAAAADSAGAPDKEGGPPPPGPCAYRAVAAACLSEDGGSRPPMSEVIDRLDALIAAQYEAAGFGSSEAGVAWATSALLLSGHALPPPPPPPPLPHCWRRGGGGGDVMVKGGAAGGMAGVGVLGGRLPRARPPAASAGGRARRMSAPAPGW